MDLTRTQRAVLDNCFLLKAIPQDKREEFLDGLEFKKFKKGQLIYSPSSFSRALALMLSGKAAVYKDNGVLLNRLGPGSCFGAAAIFSPQKEYVTQVLAEQSCCLLLASDEQLKELFRQYPEAALAYICFLSERIRFLNRKIDSFTTGSSEQALRKWLASAENDGKVRVRSYAALARELNIGRASLYRALAQLEEKGEIIKNGGEISILGRENIGGK